MRRPSDCSRTLQPLDLSPIMRTERTHYDETCFRVWPDGTAQDIDDGEPYDWMSDDYALVWAYTPEEAARKVGAEPYARA